MAFTLIAHTATTTSHDTTTAVTAAITTTGANLLIAWTAEASESTPGVLSDSKGNVWVPVISEPAAIGTSGSRVRLYAALNPTVGTGHTCTILGAADCRPSLSFAAFSTGSTVASVDVSVGATNTVAATTLATGTLTPNGNNELLVSAVAFGSNPSASVNASYTALDTVAYNASWRGLASAYQIQTTGTARNPTWTVTAPTGLSVAQAAFYVASAGVITVTKATTPTGSPQPFGFSAFATSTSTLYTASGGLTTVSVPRYNPAGTLVVFAATGASPGIYSIHTDGSALTQLTSTAGDTAPCFNPAGDRIVYVSPVLGVNQVFIMHIDGTVQTQLTAVAGSSGTDPTYKPDGSVILYTKTVTATGASTLWTMLPDGTSKTLFFDYSPNAISQGQFSPDAAYVLFLATGVGAGVYRMLANTTGVTQWPIVGTASNWNWAPDSTGVAFTLNSATLGWVNTAGAGQTTVYSAVTSTAPAYAPNGKTLVFAGSGGTTLLTLASLLAPALFTLTDGMSRSFTGLGAASNYRLAETAVSGWSTVYTVSNGSITAIVVTGTATTTVKVANTYASPTTYTRKIVRRRVGPHMSNEQLWNFFTRFQLDLESGTANADAPNPIVTLRWSDDGGHTWTQGVDVSAGTAGAYSTRLLWYQLGRSRDRIFRIDMDDPVKWAIVNAYVQSTPGTS